MILTFLGAAGTVTGSKYLIELEDKKILVDCGLFQGLKELRLMNWMPPRFNPSSIDAILLTHGHMDHTGYLPRLVKMGFKGDIFGTEPTLEIAEIILKDSAKIHEEEAKRANRDGYSKHKPALPLYDLKDVNKTLRLFKPVQEGKRLQIDDLFTATFQYNGHILGSTFIEMEVEGKTIVFSGDLGRQKDLLLYPPKKPRHADVLLIESTYGGRIHPPEETIAPQLEEIINKTIHRGGSIFIPSFAVERNQLLMVILWRLHKERRIPHVPMIMDSPMGGNVLELFRHSHEWHKLSIEECNQMCSHFLITDSYSETMKLRVDKKPKIVIAGSGMMTGGRILSYIEERASHHKDTLLFVGYQAEGTRGRKLLDGEKEVKIYGKTLPFRMEIQQIEGLSAHGDQSELIDWLSDLKKSPRTYIVHGEPKAAEAFKRKLQEVKGWIAEIPELYESIEL